MRGKGYCRHTHRETKVFEFAPFSKFIFHRLGLYREIETERTYDKHPCAEGEGLGHGAAVEQEAHGRAEGKPENTYDTEHHSD